jgi:hypothetical protein
VAFDGLKKHYRCEYVYKAILNDRIVFGRHSPRTASLHVELPVGGSIVDLAVVNGTLTAYEIKTELDGHRRLESQAESYLKVFERVYLVTHPRLASRYAGMTDVRVGILSLTDRGSLSEERPALDNGDRLSAEHLFRLLRASEYRLALERHFGPQGSVPNGRQFGHFEKLWVRLSLSEAARLVREALRARTTGADTAAFLRELPPSWRVLGYATPLSNVQRARVLNALG